jgi:hypothetical protein
MEYSLGKIFGTPKENWRNKVKHQKENRNRELFSKLSVKFYSFILLFVVGNMEELQTNSDIQVMYKAQISPPVPSSNLTEYQKGVYCTGIRLFGRLQIKLFTRRPPIING